MPTKSMERADTSAASGSPKRRAAPTISDAQLLSVLDTAADGIIIIDARGVVITFNKACERLFGYSAAEVIGQNVKMIMPSDLARVHDNYINNYLTTGERKIIGIGREVKGQHRDGTLIPVHLSVGEASTSAGRQFIGILRDLRARNESEQRLNQLQTDLVRMARVSAIDEMGAALAHELNQPLTALMLYLQAVERACAKHSANPMPAGVLSILEKAVREAERAGSIIQRMRQFVEKRDPMRRIVDLKRQDVLTDVSDAKALVEAEADAIEHMNTDHADACRLYATRLLGAGDGDWRCVGIDPEGIELQNRRTALRLQFPRRIIAPGALRIMLKELADEARSR